MILQQNSTDVRVNYFYDGDNVIQPIDVLYERHIVNPNGLIQLKNIPSPLHTVFTIIRRNGTNVIQYNKVESVVNQYDFMVDYINGILTFHSSQVGKEIQISYTNSIGQLNISADVIFTNIDNQGNIVQTLGTMIDEGRSVLSDLSVFGGASKVITELQGYIESARELTGNIIQGSNINTELKKSTDTAKSTNTTLNSTILNANNKISDMNNWVESHGDIINLDNRVGTAENKLNDVSASLEQINQQKLSKGSVSVSDINKNLGKLDQTYLSDQLLQQIAGNTPVNAIPSNKSITRSKIASASVGINELENIKKSTNLFNRNDVLIGKVILSGTGEVSNHDSFQVSDFIEINPSDVLTSVKINRITFYNENKVYVSYANNETPSQGTALVTTVPNNAFYMRISTLNNYSTLAQINKGNTLLPYEEWHKPILTDIKVSSLIDDSVKTNNIKNGEVTITKTNFIASSTNLFNKKLIVKGYNLSSSTGDLVVNSAYETSDYIEIKELTNYSYYGFNAIAYYDGEKKFINRPTLVYTGQTLQSPQKAKYIRVHYQPNNANLPRQINESDSLLPYEDYYSIFTANSGLENLNDIIKHNRINTKDKYMIDLPVDGVFNTNETFEDYTDFSNSTSNEVYSMFDVLMNQYPDYITKEFLGNDSVGNPISVYYFTPSIPQSDLTTKMPKIFLTCGTHGMEKASTLSAYLMLKQMCEKWRDYPLLEALRFNTKIIIIPIVNPSGWNAFTRVNVNNVDINRNFPFEWVQGTAGTPTYGGTVPLSELESQYIMSIFNNNEDIDMMYDFHNFHTESNGNYFMWVPTASGEYVQHMAQNLFSRLTRKWKKEYNFIPDNYFAGYTSTERNGMIQNYAQSIGIKFSATFEICWKWVLDTTSVPYDQITCKTGVEALTNWLLINLKELIK